MSIGNGSLGTMALRASPVQRRRNYMFAEGRRQGKCRRKRRKSRWEKEMAFRRWAWTQPPMDYPKLLFRYLIG